MSSLLVNKLDNLKFDWMAVTSQRCCEVTATKRFDILAKKNT